MVQTGDSPERTTLDNGLVLLTVRRSALPLVAVLLLYRAGSVYDPAGRTGLAHLTEHMMFRGTPSRPHGSIDLLTGSLGGMNNALTTSDHALYYFVLPSEHWKVPLSIEADRMLHCDLTSEAFETERMVAVEERMMLDDDPDTLLFEAVDLLAFDRHPYRYPVVGRLSDLERLTREDAVRFYGERYRPENAVLAVVGDVEPAHVASVAAALFDSGAGAAGGEARPGPEPAVTSPRRTDVLGGGSVPRVAVAYRVPPATDADTPALELLAAVLSSGRGSLMYGRLVDDLGIATEVAATMIPQEDPSLFYISASLHPDESPERCELEILGLLDDIRRSGIREEALSRARRLTRVDLLMGRETCLGLAGALAFWESMGGWELGEEHERRLAQVTAADIRSVAGRYFRPESRSTACLSR